MLPVASHLKWLTVPDPALEFEDLQNHPFLPLLHLYLMFLHNLCRGGRSNEGSWKRKRCFVSIMFWHLWWMCGLLCRPGPHRGRSVSETRELPTTVPTQRRPACAQENTRGVHAPTQMVAAVLPCLCLLCGIFAVLMPLKKTPATNETYQWHILPHCV